MTIRHETLWSSVLCLALSGCGSPVDGQASGERAEPAESSSDSADDDGDERHEPTASVGLPGEYEVQPVSFHAEPQGCRLNADAPPPWTWEIGDPEQDEWSLVERVLVDGQVREVTYDCSRAGSTFSCTYVTVVDHGAFGQDAEVSLEVVYDGAWIDADTLSADFHLQFACEGAACSDVASHWTVTGFPCVNEGSVQGTRK
jgi:hypothetical protein